jgi:cyclopropane-fatty-acyl-phospholipid synthase
MKSRLFTGQLQHARTHVVEHSFAYSLHLFALDLDELEQLDRDSFWFGYNRKRPLALHDRDYLYPGNMPLIAKVCRALEENGINREPARVVLVTALRQFHYVFNPVSFFYCYDQEDKVFCVLAQVNNTFGETHLYVLRHQSGDYTFETEKAFHVSPFFPRKGRYAFRLSPLGETLLLEITFFLDADKPALVASFTGTSRPLTPATMARTVCLHPLRAVLTFPRILWQAGRLYFQKRLKVYTKPDPCSPLTLRQASPSLLERLGRKVMTRFFSQLDHGRMTMTLPEGGQLVFGRADGSPQVAMHIERNRFFQRAMLTADIGFGEAYVDGDWNSPDLVALLSLLNLREEAVNDRRIWPALAGRLINLMVHRRRDNTPAGSRRNISEHYDLSNDLYALFLDPTMAYSSGIFLNPNDSLEQSQHNKFRAVIDKAAIGPEDHVLEIGCGWGGFAIEAVRQTGCRLTGITVSREQFDWATRRVQEEGLADRITILLSDYRHVEGRFSKIVSIEMIEAVGHQHLPLYFSTLDKLLAPGGRIFLQVITIPDQKYGAYRAGSDWIRKHIFPGGHLPSVGAMVSAMSSKTRFNIIGMEDIGHHYIRALQLWREAFLNRRQEVFDLGFDPTFVRKWEYYFSYCEAGFRNRLVRNYHLVLARMGEPVEEIWL